MVFFFGGGGVLIIAHAALRGGAIRLYLPLTQARYARTPSLALRGEAGGLADPPGVWEQQPLQSSQQMPQRSGAAQHGRRGGRGSLSRLRRDSGVSGAPDAQSP